MPRAAGLFCPQPPPKAVMAGTSPATPLSTSSSSLQGPPSASKSAAGLTPIANAENQLCCNCETEVDASELVAWSSRLLSCAVCKRNYKRLSERIKANKSLGAWWP